jgi:hypothetical protein
VKSNCSFIAIADLSLSCKEKYSYKLDPVPDDPCSPAAPWWKVAVGSCAEASAAASGVRMKRGSGSQSIA